MNLFQKRITSRISNLSLVDRISDYKLFILKAIKLFIMLVLFRMPSQEI